ncbi:triacylglycerol lipase [Nocardia seriolae]|uniref:Triacylglycerol lipase n=1 Tax=Nocardia seriolae TaxID=37332 RepID=A0ABC9Z0P9_9NOCA|nr:triacylglycerol lipase [Nocardia seriolae]GAM49370.1 triacylglycerol lipase [Nocardia seriolae]GAP31354.1 triacylglycerol lipase [Nocardia seriolae]
MRLGTVSISVLTVAALTAGPAPADPAPPSIQPAQIVPLPPELDPSFYNPPAGVVAAAAPGEIIAARQVNVANLGLIPLNVDAWQVSYRSNNSRDEAIAAVATLLKPRGVAPAPRKLLSVQIAEDSTQGYCSPSYALQQFSVAPFVGQIVAPAEFVMAQAALQKGDAVVIPDHQGPHSAYAAGPLGGRITLDGIRAATSFAPLGVGAGAPVALYGYSGGSMPTMHAAELRKTYAPELNIVAAASGGTGADLGAALLMANNQATSGLVLGAVLGLAREYPDFNALLDQRLNPLGQLLRTVKAPFCVQYQTALLPFLNITGMINSPDPLREPAVQAMLEDTRLGKSLPDMPVFMWHSKWDEILPLGSADRLVDTYCQDPAAQVTYTRDWASEHIVAEVTGGPAALMWLFDRLNGVAAQPGCSTIDSPSMLGTPGELQTLTETLGETLASFFGKPIGARAVTRATFGWRTRVPLR